MNVSVSLIEGFRQEFEELPSNWKENNYIISGPGNKKLYKMLEAVKDSSFLYTAENNIWKILEHEVFWEDLNKWIKKVVFKEDISKRDPEVIKFNKDILQLITDSSGEGLSKVQIHLNIEEKFIEDFEKLVEKYPSLNVKNKEKILKYDWDVILRVLPELTLLDKIFEIPYSFEDVSSKRKRKTKN